MEYLIRYYGRTISIFPQLSLPILYRHRPRWVSTKRRQVGRPAPQECTVRGRVEYILKATERLRTLVLANILYDLGLSDEAVSRGSGRKSGFLYGFCTSRWRCENKPERENSRSSKAAVGLPINPPARIIPRRFACADTPEPGRRASRRRMRRHAPGHVALAAIAGGLSGPSARAGGAGG